MNQCQGCQAGWPIVIKDSSFSGGTYRFHAVKGGYIGELCMCTKSDYLDDKQEEPK